MTARPVALVTGASGGIGAAVARMLAQDGHPVVMCGRDRIRLAQAAAGLAAPVHLATFDMTDPAAIAALPGSLPPGFARVDIVVNAAGHDVGGRRPFEEGEPEDWAAIVDANLTGLMRLTHPFVRGMIARKAAGDVVNIGSLGALRPAPRMAAYTASKAGMHSFSDVLRADLGRHGIRVSEILPGLTHTGFAEARLRGDAGKAAGFYAKADAVLTPADVAAAVLNALRQPRHVTVAQTVVVPSGQW